MIKFCQFLKYQSIAAIVAMAPAHAIAQSVDADSSSQTFKASYYEPFAPLTAYDMLLRTPGFQINLGESKRGLGQSSVNVLLNGNRLAGKSNDPVDQMTRVAAGNVVRIELIDGARSGVPGLAGLVANVITSSSGQSGNWSWSPAIRNYVEPNLGRASISISGTKGDLEYSLSANNTSNRLGSRGPEIRRDQNGVITDIVDEQDDGAAFGPTLSAKLGWQIKPEIRTNFEATYSDFNINDRELSTRMPETSSSLSQSAFFFGLDRRQGEVSGDISWPVGSGQAKVIGVYNFLDDDEVSVIERRSLNGLIGAERFELDLSTSEMVLRTEYQWAATKDKSLQLAVEYARNDLSATSELFSAEGDIPLSPIALSDPDTNVSEDRFEGTATYNWTLSNTVNIQSMLGGEYSILTQEDIAGDQNQKFLRPKGFFTLTYSPDGSLSISSKIERKVGQLNFFDFTSSVSLEDNLDQTGNPDLVPAQTWRGELILNKTLSDGHTANLTLFGEEITDLVDRIAIGETGDAVGNIDSASRLGIKSSLSIKGEAWGWKGVEVQLEYDATRSKVNDPIEGFERGLNNEVKERFLLEYTHDIPNSPWAYGSKIDQTKFEPVYRVRTIDQNLNSPFATIYVEHKDIFGMKVRANIVNVTDQYTQLNRQLYQARRDTLATPRTESRKRRYGPFLRLDISGQF